MDTTTGKRKIKTSEVAEALGWTYTTANSIKSRKSPKARYEMYLECEKRLREAKEKINKELSNQA